MAGATAAGQLSLAVAQPRVSQPSQQDENVTPASGGTPGLPSLPHGISTVLGGQIRDVNPVLDEFSLHISGERPLKILYDARTRLYRDGKRVPVLQLGAAEHASVQTILDGSHVFALSIHILSQAPEGQCEGVISEYNPMTGELSVDSLLSPSPVQIIVPAGAAISRIGERTFKSRTSGAADLVSGALVSVRFTPDPAGRPVAKEIEVLAVPGSVFYFAGNIVYLNMASGVLVLLDPRDAKSYQIHFSTSRLPAARDLRTGDRVSITASYDGRGYRADKITVD